MSTKKILIQLSDETITILALTGKSRQQAISEAIDFWIQTKTSFLQERLVEKGKKIKEIHLNLQSNQNQWW